MADDLSGATLADFQEVDPKTGQPLLKEGSTVSHSEVTTLPSEEPNIVKHTPDTYAGLTGQQALIRMWNQGLYPTPDDIKSIESSALSRSQDFRKGVAEKQQAEQIAREHEIYELSPLTDAKGNVLKDAQGNPVSPTQLKAQEEGQVALQKEQAEQGPSAAAAAARQGLVGKAVLNKLPDTESDKLAMYTNGYNSVNDLGNAFSTMMAGGHSSTAPVVGKDDNPAFGTGGFWRSLGGKLSWVAENTSPAALNFVRQRDISNIPIARSVLGETGATPTKEAMMEKAETLLLPRVQDDELTGNAQLFNFKRSIINNLQTLFNVNKGKYDTSQISEALANLHSDFDSAAVQRWNPVNQQALVGNGMTAPAKETTQNVNAGANKGISLVPGANAAPANTGTLNPDAARAAAGAAAAGAPYQLGSSAPGAAPSHADPMGWIYGAGRVGAPNPSGYGAAAQQAGQYAGGKSALTPATLQTPSAQQLHELLSQPSPNQTIFQTWPAQVGGTIGGTARGIWQAIQSQLPENQPIERFQQ